MCLGTKLSLFELKESWVTYRGAIKVPQEMLPAVQCHKETSLAAQGHLPSALQGPVAKDLSMPCANPCCFPPSIRESVHVKARCSGHDCLLGVPRVHTTNSRVCSDLRSQVPRCSPTRQPAPSASLGQSPRCTLDLPLLLVPPRPISCHLPLT